MKKAAIRAQFKRIAVLARELAILERGLPSIDHWNDMVGESFFGNTPAEAILESANWGIENADFYLDQDS